MKTLGSILVVAGVLALCGGVALKSNWINEQPTSTRAAFNALHGHEQLHIDDLQIQNATIQMEIDRRQGHRNDGSALREATALKATDEAFAREADAARAAQPEENVTGEYVAFGFGLIAIVIGGILQTSRSHVPIPA